METFKTQFMMSGVATDATVQALPDDSFACTLNLVDFFDGGEFEGGKPDPDVTIKQSANGNWEIIGESKIALTSYDLESLGQAVSKDYHS